MRRVDVDFSTTVRGGLIRVALRRFHGDAPTVGESVEAVDDDEGLAFTGSVVDVDGRFAYLEMNWTSRDVVGGVNWLLGANVSVISGGETGNERPVGIGLPRVIPTTVVPRVPFLSAQSA